MDISGYSNKANAGYTYDALNRVATETSGSTTHSYSYDLNGNRTNVTYGGTGLTVASAYDALNRLSTLTQGTSVVNYIYDLNGNVVQKTMPNGDVTTMTYDALNRLGSTQTLSSLNVLDQGYAMGYDLDGNVCTIAETYHDTASDRNLIQSYDPINRLTNETSVQASSTTSTVYTYDTANNRMSRSVTGGTSAGQTTYQYSNVNQLVSTSAGDAYTYDANGDRLTHAYASGTDTYSYDQENRLVSVVQGGTTYGYIYDYRTRRVERDEGSTDTTVVYSGGLSVQEVTGGTTAVEYIRGSDMGGGVGGILYSLRSGTPSYTYYNNRGDVVAKIGDNGILTYQASYEAYGKRTQESGSSQDRQRANTKEEDPTGLLNEGFRYRDLDAGVFISKDPAGMIDGPNLYTYVNQNPWTHFDSEGLASEEWKKKHPIITAVSDFVSHLTGAILGAVTPPQGVGGPSSKLEDLSELHEKMQSGELNPTASAAGLGNAFGTASLSLLGGGIKDTVTEPSVPRASNDGTDVKNATNPDGQTATQAKEQADTEINAATGGTGKGSLNPRTKAAAIRGSSLHSDKPGNLPDQLRSMFPETQFDFKPPGKPGQDVTATDGLHPSFYPYGNWPEGVNHADFKPDTDTGRRTFNSDQQNKWLEPTKMLLYNPDTGVLNEEP